MSHRINEGLAVFGVPEGGEVVENLPFGASYVVDYIITDFGRVTVDRGWCVEVWVVGPGKTQGTVRLSLLQHRRIRGGQEFPLFLTVAHLILDSILSVAWCRWAWLRVWSNWRAYRERQEEKGRKL